MSPKPPSRERLRTSPPRSRLGLVFDIENKPGTYGPGDYTHGKVTAIAWQLGVQREDPRFHKPVGRVLRRSDVQGCRDIAEEFREAWEASDFVVAHNGRQHDVKLLGGLYMALGLELLPERRMVDTYRDQPRLAGLSRSLENLSERWDCPIRKPHMPEHVWEAAYDGIEWAEERMRRRVVADVAITAWLYRTLVEKGLLTR